MGSSFAVHGTVRYAQELSCQGPRLSLPTKPLPATPVFRVLSQVGKLTLEDIRFFATFPRVFLSEDTVCGSSERAERVLRIPRHREIHTGERLHVSTAKKHWTKTCGMGLVGLSSFVDSLATGGRCRVDVLGRILGSQTRMGTAVFLNLASLDIRHRSTVWLFLTGVLTAGLDKLISKFASLCRRRADPG